MAAQFDIVIVDFPFVERNSSRQRPAVVLSVDENNTKTGVAIVAMITRLDAPAWYGDLIVQKYENSGLNKPCKIRMKIFTIDLSASRNVGRLDPVDQQRLTDTLKQTFAL